MRDGGSVGSWRKSRYQRHELIDGFSQDELARSRIAVVGCGAVGNEAVQTPFAGVNLYHDSFFPLTGELWNRLPAPVFPKKKKK